MFQTQNRDGYNIINLTDGNLLTEAATFINQGNADGINLNYIKNWPLDLEALRDLNTIKSIIVNDYPTSSEYDYSAIHSMGNLEHISINTTDRKEISFSSWPKLNSVALMWRPKAKTLFDCVNLQRLFIGQYTGKDLTEISKLKQLWYLRINTGSVTSLQGLSQIGELNELQLMQITKLKDIDDILKLTKLKRLRIDNCKQIQNIESIKKMHIHSLEIVGTTPN